MRTYAPGAGQNRPRLFPRSFARRRRIRLLGTILCWTALKDKSTLMDGSKAIGTFRLESNMRLSPELGFCEPTILRKRLTIEAKSRGQDSQTLLLVVA